MRRLEVGDIYDVPDGEPGQWEVVRVSNYSAVVRPRKRERRVILDDEGGVRAEFDAPGKTHQVSPYSSVRLLGNVREMGMEEEGEVAEEVRPAGKVHFDVGGPFCGASSTRLTEVEEEVTCRRCQDRIGLQEVV